MDTSIASPERADYKMPVGGIRLRTVPDPILNREAYECYEDELPHLVDLAKIMYNIMHREKGIGLAANQVGVLKRLIVGSVGHERFALINPYVAKITSHTCAIEEGCLSVPGQRVKVTRPKIITVRGLSLKWEPVKIKCRGILAACLQHEIDHLNGITILEK